MKSRSPGSRKERLALRLVRSSMPEDSKPSQNGSQSQTGKGTRKTSLDWPVPWVSPLPPSESGNETPEWSEESSKSSSKPEPT